ncbi:hypothetical protein BDN70DRAFT_982945 [Pholiota conissans]|uniref:Uncharacterized protein n=1 Tax=Pholiota conissans TaxID=109636 RepID=A0A9P6D6R4_9AGAR|nr:hypothetical protein BDN70DRAFT_982945 [Pholiota conissans]
MAFVTSLWLALLGTFYILGSAAQDYSITGYIASGTGCSPSTFSSSLASDGKNVGLKYGSFTAYAGPSYSYDDGRKNCQLTLSVKVPGGYQFAFDKFNHNASYAIGQDVTGSFKTSYYFQATLPEAEGDGTIAGPAKLDTTLTDNFSPLVWSPCGQNAVVGINTEVRVDNGNNNAASGSFTIRSTPVSFTESYA